MDEPTEYLAGLNGPQKEAVLHHRGHLLVLAGAGSGKTRVLTTRIAHLVREHQVDPYKILAVTFTNKAAEEMRKRIDSITPRAERLSMGTFHSFGAQFLRKHADKMGWKRSFTILDADDALKEITRIFKARPLQDDSWTPQMFRGLISEFKNELLDPAAARAQALNQSDERLNAASEIYSVYQDTLEKSQSVDFDDLLRLPVDLLDAHADLKDYYAGRYDHVLIDEYQDTNVAQYELIRRLAGPKCNLMVVGDDDQAIYGWRGASLRNILDFEKDFAGTTTIRLEQNYRSTGNILAAANAVIGKNMGRKGKTLWTQEGQGEKLQLHITPDDRDEADLVVGTIVKEISAGRAPKDMAILYRTNAQSRQMEQALRKKGVLYRLIGGLAFYERKEVKDVLAYARLLLNELDDVAFARVINVPRRGVGDKSLDLLRQRAHTDKISLLEAAGGATLIAGMPKKAGAALEELARKLRKIGATAEKIPVAGVFEQIISDFSLKEEYKKDKEDGEARIENITSLVASAAEFVEDSGELGNLTAFLEQTALMSDIDMAPDTDVVSLMTLHSAKGLEFPVVFLVGMEQGLFPHGRSIGQPKQLEEERRLFYVGITRAEESCIMTMANQRRLGSQITQTSASEFLADIPRALVLKKEHASAARNFYGQRGAGASGRPAYARWGAVERSANNKSYNNSNNNDDNDNNELDAFGLGEQPSVVRPAPAAARLSSSSEWQGKMVRIIGEESLGPGEVRLVMDIGSMAKTAKAVVVFGNGLKRTVGTDQLIPAASRSLRP